MQVSTGRWYWLAFPTSSARKDIRVGSLLSSEGHLAPLLSTFMLLAVCEMVFEALMMALLFLIVHSPSVLCYSVLLGIAVRMPQMGMALFLRGC